MGSCNGKSKVNQPPPAAAFIQLSGNARPVSQGRRQSNAAAHRRLSASANSAPDPWALPERRSSSRGSSDNFRRVGSDPQVKKTKKLDTARPRNKSRYEGLESATQLSKTAIRNSARKSIKGPRSSQDGRSRKNSVMAFVAGNKAFEFDVTPTMQAPPVPLPGPPPPEMAASHPSPNRGKLSEVDATFVDYTVVPLLLRANMDWNDANRFGEVLKKHYKGTHIRFIMSNPFELFAAIEATGMVVQNDMKMKVVEDMFWKQNQEDDPNTRNKRTSFVYYREEAAEPAKPPARALTRATKRLSERKSMKKEFGQTKALSPGEPDDFSIDMDQVKQSLAYFDKSGYSPVQKRQPPGAPKRPEQYDDLTI